MEKCIFVFITLLSFLLVYFSFKEIFYQSNIKYQLNRNIFKTTNGSKYIPKTIHQIFIPDKTKMHSVFKNNVDRIKKLNPNWKHILYDNNDIDKYIKTNYGIQMLNIYNMINPEYAAARADFFRYLLMYKEGGVYLDIKSGMKYALDVIINEDDQYIISHWAGKPNAHLLDNKNGEFQQWHIICRPNHPYLKAVINNVISNILNYDVKKDGVSKLGVLKVTGPIVYSKSIQPILSQYNHKLYKANEYFGLIYNNLQNNTYLFSHKMFFNKKHYSNLSTPIVIK